MAGIFFLRQWATSVGQRWQNEERPAAAEKGAVVRPLPCAHRGGMPTASAPGFTVKEAVAMTGVPERSVRRYVADGRLDVIRRGRSIFLTRDSVRALRDDLRARRFPSSQLTEED